MVFVMETEQRRRPVCVWVTVNAYLRMFNPLKNREKPPFQSFSSRTLDSPSGLHLHQLVFTVAAYCLSPAGGPGILVLQTQQPR